MIFRDVSEFVNETLTTRSLVSHNRRLCARCSGSALWIKSNLHNRALQTEETVPNLNYIFFGAQSGPACVNETQRLMPSPIGAAGELLVGVKFCMILWVKALHVIAVIAWMAGMLYLPRLLVYHVAAANGSDVSETFKVMERRLLKAIMNPSMLLVFLTGFVLVYLTGDWQDGWWQAKFVLVLGLAGLHGYFARCVRSFAKDANERPARFYRLLNEAPTILMILIVVLAVVKPF
jgi:protoporphyrinogen IX oxidase